MFKNNKDFFPTPKWLIDKMLCDINLKIVKSILEPSAGNGNIVEVLKEKEKIYSTSYYTHKFDIDCIEIDENLQRILKGKGFRVVHNDFLTYDTMKEYDLIIANFPFSNGCKHLLKALEMQEKNGGAIVCLLNAETIKNPYTNDRQYLQSMLTEHNAKIEFIQNAFADAERETNVEVALIRVQFQKVQRKSFILDGLKKIQEQKEIEETVGNYLIENDFFKAIVNQYKMEVEAGISLIKEYCAMKPFILSSFEKDESTGKIIQAGGCILSLNIAADKDNELSINEYIRQVRGKYWSALFKNPKFTGQLTGNLQKEFYNKINALKDYDFSLYNIYQLKIDMQKQVVKGIEDTIIALFDELSDKHHWYDEMSNNIHYYNGWKTNKCWIINKKVIIPLNAYGTYFRDSFSPTDYNVIRKLEDMEKCFNYLDGGLTDAVDLHEILRVARENSQTKNIRLKYFTVTFYKKGTCHITFNNDELLKKFNIFGSQYKGWLPPSYGKKAYEDMTTEEKAVVNEFEGEKEYKKIMSNRNYYLFDRNNLNLLEDKTV